MTDRSRTDLTYTKRNEDGDDIININISWENGDLNSLQYNLNTWLRSMGVPLKVVADTAGAGQTQPVNQGAGSDPF